jgi:hypothetical protein
MSFSELWTFSFPFWCLDTSTPEDVCGYNSDTPLVTGSTQLKDSWVPSKLSQGKIPMVSRGPYALPQLLILQELWRRRISASIF